MALAAMKRHRRGEVRVGG